MIKYEKYSHISSTYGLLGKIVFNELDPMVDDHEPNVCSACTSKMADKAQKLSLNCIFLLIP